MLLGLTQYVLGRKRVETGFSRSVPAKAGTYTEPLTPAEEKRIFVITLAPVFAWLWVRLGKREPESATKFAAGLLLVSLGYLLLPAAVAAGTRGVQVSPMWLTGQPLYQIFGVVCAVLAVGSVVVALLRRPVQRLTAEEVGARSRAPLRLNDRYFTLTQPLSAFDHWY